VAHGNYVNGALRIVQRVNHAIIANSNAPEILPIPEFLASCGSGLGTQGFDFWEEPAQQLRG